MSKNDKMVERAIAAIRELFADTSVSRATTKRNLESVRDEIDILLDTLS